MKHAQEFVDDKWKLYERMAKDGDAKAEQK
jgi:hypothetical protein